LVRWLKVNFGEAFIAWIHVKALRVFVESVLRLVYCCDKNVATAVELCSILNFIPGFFALANFDVLYQVRLASQLPGNVTVSPEENAEKASRNPAAAVWPS
jgi:hypothetical protein